MVVKAAKIYTPEDLLTMPDGDRYELIDGQLVEREMSAGATLVTGRVFRYLDRFSESVYPGWLYTEKVGFQIFPDHPSRVRMADVSFFALGRLTEEQAEARGYLRIPPDLAVEVVSPNDLLYDVDLKVEEWLSAGVQMVWTINPESRYLRVYRADRQPEHFGKSSELVLEDVLPGFRLSIAKLFRRS